MITDKSNYGTNDIFDDSGPVDNLPDTDKSNNDCNYISDYLELVVDNLPDTDIRIDDNKDISDFIESVKLIFIKISDGTNDIFDYLESVDYLTDTDQSNEIFDFIELVKLTFIKSIMILLRILTI